MLAKVLSKSIILLLLVLPLLTKADTLRVAAAANLRFVLPELITIYEQASQHKINVTYGASGNLATQIIHGAPYDVFLSAYPLYVDSLVAQQKNRGEPIDYARSELVLFANHNSALKLDAELKGLRHAIEQKQIQKFAIANPKLAPYGRLARKHLTQAGLWERIQPQLLLAESASQTLQFALVSNVSGAILPYPYMTQENIQRQGRYIKLSGELSQQVVILKSALPIAESFIEFLTSEPAEPILIKHGYIPHRGEP